jgi:RimJ/RimL family protein N-acetyltransferase
VKYSPETMKTLFQTERLIVRPWNPPEDAASAFEIYGDPEVMRFIRPPEANLEAMRSRLQATLARYKERNNGTGSWAVMERETGQVVGCILLIQLPDNQEVPTSDYETGWHFRRASWGKGYATESGRGMLAYGFEVLRLPVLYAVVKPDNLASIRVTQRLEMQPMGLTRNYYGVELLLFQRENAEINSLS